MVKIAILCIVFVIVCLVVSFFNASHITVPYHYEGSYPSLVHEALNRWNVVGVYFKPSLNGPLKITHNPPSDFTHPLWGGEYRYFHILLNSRYRFLVDDFKGLVVHESGHFIGLPHSKDPHSVMNHDSSYSTPLSEQDIKNAKNLKWFLWLKLLFYRLTVAPCP